MGNKITITITGIADSGQTELAGRIAQLLEYLDIPVTFDNPAKMENASAETVDNWRSELASMAPQVHIVEAVLVEDEHARKRRAFIESLNKSSAMVATWPEWKKGGLCYEIEQPDEEPYDTRKTYGNKILARLEQLQAARKKE